jgi:hypothetical protein
MMIFLVLLFLTTSGQVVLEKKPYASVEECVDKGFKYAESKDADPRNQGVLYGACMPLAAQEVSSK